jgi:hypothetical protein
MPSETLNMREPVKKTNIKFYAIIGAFLITWLFLFDLWVEMRNIKEQMIEISYKRVQFHE